MAKEVYERDNSFGVAGVVLGVMSILSVSAMGIVTGVVGLVFSIMQNKKGKNKWSTAGIALNIIGIILGIIAIIFLVNFASQVLANLPAQGGY